VSIVLIEHLPLLATAPQGIEKLRDLILQLAVRGKLVAQDPRDEPADKLLERIAQERASLVAQGLCNKSNAVPFVDEGNSPFSLPGTWAWVRLSDTYYSISPSGNKLLSSEIQEVGEVPVVDQGKRFIAGYTDDVSLTIKIPGPVVIFGDHTTERKYVDFDFVAGADGVKILRPILQNEKFFFRQLQSFQLEERGYARHFKVLNNQLYALAPLAEQQRIVAKVDELMALCDQLEEEHADAESVQAQLVETLLDTLTQSTDAADFTVNWQRIAEYFDTLFNNESGLDALKQTILQLAVMGKLVPQDPDDEPASKLFTRIAQVRTQFKTQAGQTKVAAMPLMRGDGLPSGWEAATLPDLCAVGGGATPSKTKSDYWGKGLPWVSPKDMKVEHLFDSQDHVTELALNETRLPRIPSGSLLIVVRGMILIHSFPVATTQVDVAINQDMKSLTPFVPEMRPYLALALRGWKLQSEKLFAFKIGIPPLAEQHRIVAKVDELMSLCDRLRTDLADARRSQGRLASALTESALKAA